MEELFRLKIVSKRQLTLPVRLLCALHLVEGDEIQFRVAGGHIISAEPWKAVPTHLLTEDVLSKIKNTEKRLDSRKGVSFSKALESINGQPRSHTRPKLPSNGKSNRLEGAIIKKGSLARIKAGSIKADSDLEPYGLEVVEKQGALR